MKKSIYRTSLVSRASDAYRNEGLSAALEKTGVKLRNSLFRSNSAIWFARELAHPSLSSRETSSSSQVQGSFSSIAPAELAEWLLSRRDLAWAADSRELEIAVLMNHGWTCWRLGDEIVGFAKVGVHKVFVVDFERTISLPENLAFMSDVYVLPPARQKGIGRQLLIATMNSLVKNSLSVLCCHIPSSNKASITLFGSLGFRSFGRIHFTRILGLPIFSTKPEVILDRMSIHGRT